MEKDRDKYTCYVELSQNELEGIDYRVSFRYGRSGIAVMAPHGGNIEPGTSEAAFAVAYDEHSFYELEGLKSSGNRNLHIKSTHFDEPRCLAMVRQSETVVTVHGCKGREEGIYIGGLCAPLREEIKSCLTRSGFAIGEHSGFPGMHRLNLCNLCLNGSGVQLELTSGLRRTMFENLTEDGRKKTTAAFDSFTAALKEALLKWRTS